MVKDAISFNPHLGIEDVHDYIDFNTFYKLAINIDEYTISLWNFVFVYEYVVSIFNVLLHTVFSSIKKIIFDLNKI